MKRDLKDFTRQTNIQLIVGAVLLFFLLGDGLIFIIWGSSAAVMGLLCLGSGLVPITVIYLVFLIIDWIIKKARKDE